jgi:small-conductance mechanosensitive channel
MDDPAPSAWFTGFGDSSINFKLVFWYPSFDGGLTVQSDVALAVDVALKEAGITIPFPQQDVYIKEIKEKLQEKPEILKKAVTKNPLAKNMDKIQEDVRKSSIEKGKSSPPKK